MTAFKSKLLKRLVFTAHLLFIVVVFTSPFFLSWKLILIFVFLYYLQILVLGGCVLTKAQFGSYDETFYHHYLNKLGFRISERKVKIVADYILPPLIFVVATVYQLFVRRKL